MTHPIQPGLLVLHGNQLELLRDAVLDWLQQNPLDPLEPAVFLVQSNGVNEWLKIALAEHTGIFAASRIMLPARFLWDTYRNMLGREAVPQRSAFDKSALSWRLMALLPALVENDPRFSPLRRFLADGDPARRLQLAARLADLFDQYQVYRADWLADWATGQDQLRRANGTLAPLHENQRWQAALWRAILQSMPEAVRIKGRAHIHQQFLATIASGDTPAHPLPRRVVLFGVSALPLQTLEALAALAQHSQVILAIPNPCQFYWGDIMDGRQALTAPRQRQAQRGGQSLSHIPLEDLHLHSHPLLASWGRLGRDFVRMLDQFDDAETTRQRFTNARIDLFSEGEGDTLLRQMQATIRDLLPLAEHPHTPPAATDTSIIFHIAHSAQREVEILHDHLLHRFSTMPGLRPRDVIVMVPDIEQFAPAIRAVFGHYPRHDPRFIPFEIGDVIDRNINPLWIALDYLLRLPHVRCRQSELCDLLEVPAFAARFDLNAEDLPRLLTWIDQAGTRWGLDTAHRAGLGLGHSGAQNTWLFAIQRMLLGYASGQGEPFAGIEPYPDVEGLDASLAGALATLITQLIALRETLATPATPAEWVQRVRALLLAFFRAETEEDRLTLGQLNTVLQHWLEACEDAAFNETLPLNVVREALMGNLRADPLNHRFVSGGITFCTLMPMRAIPFRVVCLLGMNEGQYPRQAATADFDLLAQAEFTRPGDRSRRDDDRYLMLEAVLAARDVLYLSWEGHSVRDNTEKAPSILVSQLRHYLEAGWALNLAERTTTHPLQPFSRRYFEVGGLPTYASEWRHAHTNPHSDPSPALPPHDPETTVLTLKNLADFVKQPVKHFFTHRLGVRFNEEDTSLHDDEPFAFNKLETYAFADLLLTTPDLTHAAHKLVREGKLPIGEHGLQWQTQLIDQYHTVRQAWEATTSAYPNACEKRPLHFEAAEVHLDDWLDTLFEGGGTTVWFMRISSKIQEDKKPRAKHLIAGWIRQLAAAALGIPVTGIILASDAIATLAPLDPTESQARLADLLACWREGMDAPLPTDRETALAKEASKENTYEGDGHNPGSITHDPYLARLWPDFASFSNQANQAAYADRLYTPLADWLKNAVKIAPIKNRPVGEEEEVS